MRPQLLGAGATRFDQQLVTDDVVAVGARRVRRGLARDGGTQREDGVTIGEVIATREPRGPCQRDLHVAFAGLGQRERLERVPAELEACRGLAGGRAAGFTRGVEAPGADALWSALVRPAQGACDRVDQLAVVEVRPELPGRCAARCSTHGLKLRAAVAPAALRVPERPSVAVVRRLCERLFGDERTFD